MGPLGWWCVAFWLATLALSAVVMINWKCIDSHKAAPNQYRVALQKCKGLLYTYVPLSVVQCVACIGCTAYLVMGMGRRD